MQEQQTETALNDPQFVEFLKTLIIISLPADKQKEIIGVGTVAIELAEDFDTYYSIACQRYFDKRFLTIEQKSELDKLDDFFDDQSGEKNPDFWDDTQLEHNNEWKTARKMALRILQLLQKDNLTIQFEKTVEKTYSDKGVPLLIERTLITLKSNS